jgi:hypothetical protein
MNSPPSPELTAGTDRTIEGERQRKRVRDLRGAQALLLEAQALASEEIEPDANGAASDLTAKENAP